MSENSKPGDVIWYRNPKLDYLEFAHGIIFNVTKTKVWFYYAGFGGDNWSCTHTLTVVASLVVPIGIVPVTVVASLVVPLAVVASLVVPIAKVSRHIIDCGKSKPTIAPNQDSLMGSYKLSLDNTNISGNVLMNLLSNTSISQYFHIIEIDPNKIYSGKDAISFIIPYLDKSLQNLFTPSPVELRARPQSLPQLNYFVHHARCNKNHL